MKQKVSRLICQLHNVPKINVNVNTVQQLFGQLELINSCLDKMIVLLEYINHFQQEKSIDVLPPKKPGAV